MDDQTITKLISRMTQIFVTKDDLRAFVTKDDLNDFKIELKADIKSVENEVSRVKTELKAEIKRVENEVKSVGNTLSKMTDELDKTGMDHENRLKKLEALPSIAH